MNQIKDIITIALADDHVLLMKSLATTINNFGDCKVIIQAVDGKDLQRQIKRQEPPDLVILDVNMPGMDGYDTAAWLADVFPSVKVLALTMYDSELVEIRMLMMGVSAVLQKDIEPDKLRERIKSIMKTESYRPEGKLFKLIQSATNNIPLVNNIYLTPNELQLLTLACSDWPYKQIAQEMHCSVKTLDHYRESLFGKLGVKNRVGMVMYALDNGIIPKRDKRIK